METSNDIIDIYFLGISRVLPACKKHHDNSNVGLLERRNTFWQSAAGDRYSYVSMESIGYALYCGGDVNDTHPNMSSGDIRINQYG